jgi:hypothetical protein
MGDPDPLPLTTPPASPSKRRSQKERTEGLMELGVHRKPSRRRGEVGSPRKDAQTSRIVSGESTRTGRQGGLKEELDACARIVSVN